MDSEFDTIMQAAAVQGAAAVLLLCRRVQHVFDEDSISGGGVIYQHMCVLMIPTKLLNFWKPRIKVNHDFAIGSLIVVNLFQNDF